MLNALTSRQELLSAQRQLEASFKQKAETFPEVQIGYQGGAVTANVYWHASLGIWGSLNDSPYGDDKGASRFWNAFGTQNPKQHGSNLSIVCEANPAHEGVDPHVAGIFARGDDGLTYLLHTGRIGGGQPGVGQKLFWEHWPYRSASVTYGKNIVEGAIVAQVDSPQATFEVARFVKEVQRIKALARS